MALKIVLNYNAEMEVVENFYVRTPLGKTIHFKAGQVLQGQHDDPENGFWIKDEDFIANIPPGHPVRINQLEEATV